MSTFRDPLQRYPWDVHFPPSPTEVEHHESVTEEVPVAEPEQAHTANHEFYAPVAEEIHVEPSTQAEPVPPVESVTPHPLLAVAQETDLRRELVIWNLVLTVCVLAVWLYSRQVTNWNRAIDHRVDQVRQLVYQKDQKTQQQIHQMKTQVETEAAYSRGRIDAIEGITGANNKKLNRLASRQQKLEQQLKQEHR